MKFVTEWRVWRILHSWKGSILQCNVKFRCVVQFWFAHFLDSQNSIYRKREVRWSGVRTTHSSRHFVRLILTELQNDKNAEWFMCVCIWVFQTRSKLIFLYFETEIDTCSTRIIKVKSFYYIYTFYWECVIILAESVNSNYMKTRIKLKQYQLDVNCVLSFKQQRYISFSSATRP